MKSFRTASFMALSAAFVLAGCNGSGTDKQEDGKVAFALPDLPATMPMSDAPPTELSEAPLASDLPDGPMLRLGRLARPEEAYGFAQAAYAYDTALGDAPPDYSIDYDGVEPWAWQGYDGSLRVSEPIEGGDRTYYYRTGAIDPYLVRDDAYAYAYSGGMLTAIFAPDGMIIPYDAYGDRLLYASRYFARGRLLYTRLRQGRRRPVIAANWVRREPRFAAAIVRWGAGASRQPAWANYGRANRQREDGYWGEERHRRDVDARRFADWRGGDFRDPAPARAIPAAWKAARWAQDDHRFRPADGREDRDTRGARNRPEQRADARQDAGGRDGDRRDRSERGGSERTDRPGVLAGGGDRPDRVRDRMGAGRDARVGADRPRDERLSDGSAGRSPDRRPDDAGFAQRAGRDRPDHQRMRERPDDRNGHAGRSEESASRERFGDQRRGRMETDRSGREDRGRDAWAQQRQAIEGRRPGADERGDRRSGGRAQPGGLGGMPQAAEDRGDRRRGGWGQQQPGFGSDRQAEGRRERPTRTQPFPGGREQADRSDRGQQMQRQQQFQAQQQMQRQQQVQAQQQMERQQQMGRQQQMERQLQMQRQQAVQQQQQMQRQQAAQQQQQMERQAQRAQPSRSDSGEQRPQRERRRRPD